MSEIVHLSLIPLGTSFEIEKGTPLQDVLFSHGVEFPCGGRGRCRGCRVKVLEGNFPITHEQEKILSREQIASGWRLACCGVIENDLTLELAQWESPILVDDTQFEFTPRDGFGIAIDLGTTTIAAQLLDLRTGFVLAVQTALNAQARYGADVMSRISYALTRDGQKNLQAIIREQIRSIIIEVLSLADVDSKNITDVMLAGNTVMHHLFCGIPVGSLSRAPFEPLSPDVHYLSTDKLGYALSSSTKIVFLPCIGGFIGSDILSGIISTKMFEREELTALVDLGTNGEIVLGNKERILCASTAAGPAFEGAKISMGMRAATGAISRVSIDRDHIVCHVIGNTSPRGICGSGLVDAIAVLLDMNLIQPNGRIAAKSDSVMLSSPVKITGGDIRELQLAKGAVAAGSKILLERFGASSDDIETLFVAGAFGNYIDPISAERIGLLPIASEKIRSVGNSALLGTKIVLFNDMKLEQCNRLREKVEHVSLYADAEFQDVFVEEMRFPERG